MSSSTDGRIESAESRGGFGLLEAGERVAGGERSEPGGRARRGAGDTLRAARVDAVAARSGGRELSPELVDDAIARARLGMAVGELPGELRERVAEGLIDELLAGRRGEREILGPEGLLGELTRRLVERALGAELSEQLGYPPGRAPPGGADARNGGTPKTLLTDHGDVRIAVPRDRRGSFEPRIVGTNQRRLAGAR